MKRLAIYGLSALLALLPASPVLAAPTGAVVIEGKIGTFDQEGDETFIETLTTETIVVPGRLVNFVVR